MNRRAVETNVVKSEEDLFYSSNKLVVASNAASAGLSAVNEVVVGHSAIGFSQMTMEATDVAMVLSLRGTARLDKKGNHIRAARVRQAIYLAHIAVAAWGIQQSVEIIQSDQPPEMENIAISTAVAAINGTAIYRDRKAKRKAVSPTDLPVFGEPVVDASAHYRMNEEGNMAIAWTNVAEAGGGLIAPHAQRAGEVFLASTQGSAFAAIGSSVAVMGIMGRQIYREERKISQHKHARTSHIEN